MVSGGGEGGGCSQPLGRGTTNLYMNIIILIYLLFSNRNGVAIRVSVVRVRWLWPLQSTPRWDLGHNFHALPCQELFLEILYALTKLMPLQFHAPWNYSIINFASNLVTCFILKNIFFHVSHTNQLRDFIGLLLYTKFVVITFCATNRRKYHERSQELFGMT